MKPVHIALNHALSRRSFLRGVGVSLSLPLLEAMRPAFGAPAPKVKRRMVAICTSFGMHAEHLFPQETGRGYKASMYSKVIDEFRDQFTLFSGLSHPDVDGAHEAENSFLTAAPHPGVSGFRNTISVDQYAVEKLAPDTRFRSLALSSLYADGISVNRSGVKVPAEDRPSKLFAKLFLEGSADEVEQQVQRLKEGESIMDTIGGQAKTLQRSVGAADRDKLDQYFTSVRELEQRLVRAQEWAKKPKPHVAMAPPKDPADRADLVASVRPMLELLHMAIQTDSTRLATLRLRGHDMVPPIEGVTQAWHSLSHHGRSPAKIKELAIVEKTEMEELRHFYQLLQSTEEEGSNLLERTMVLYGSNLGNASSHDTRNMPILLAGGGFQHGQHLAFDQVNNTPLCNLYLQMLRRMEIDTDAFASSRGEIKGFSAV